MKRKVDTRPWGNFVQFTENEPSTVKIITVNPGEELSLQRHEHRNEFWRVLSGHPTIIVDSATTQAKPGDEFTVPEQAPHRIQAVSDSVEILEISFGTFSEDDIIRLEDKYGRAQS